MKDKLLDGIASCIAAPLALAWVTWQIVKASAALALAWLLMTRL